jgi:hypothetical protein
MLCQVQDRRDGECRDKDVSLWKTTDIQCPGEEESDMLHEVQDIEDDKYG